MRVQIGPVASGSVTAWVAYARKALDEVLAEPGEEGVWLPADTADTFRSYLDAWELLALDEDDFRWAGDVAADEAEYLSHAFFRVVSHLALRAERRGYSAAPAEGEEFYRALVGSFLGALDAEGAGSQEFAEHLRAFWPGMEPE